MPAKAKLTTRNTATTTVTSDNLAKGTELTFNEADSNFINLRDQSIAISDGVTTTDIEAGETITFSGASVSGNTVTITGGGANLGDLQVNGTELKPVTTNNDLILTANGTGTVIVYDNLSVSSDGKTGNNLGNLLRVNASSVTINHNGDYDSTIFEVAGQEGQNVNYRRPFEIKGELGLSTGGSPGNTDGRVYINGIKFPMGPGSNGQILTTNGTDEYSWTNLSSLIDLITIVGDDSTGTVVNTGETFKFAGGTNITTAVSGDTLTITGPDLSNYIQNTSRALAIVGDDSTGTDFNYGETVKIAGAGGVTTAVSGDTVTITGPTGTLSNVVEDTTPQLGGNLDVNGKSIVSTSAGNISITPDTTGKIILDGLSWPTADGTANQVLKTDGAGNLSFVSSSGIGSLLDDTTPQLGGDLDLNGYKIKNDLGGVIIKDNVELDNGFGNDATLSTPNGSPLVLASGSSTPAYIKLEYNTPKDIKLNLIASGRLDFLDPSGTITSTTIGANGSASALTANPVGYLKIKIAGTEYQIPYYNT